jgi:uncharacterized protein
MDDSSAARCGSKIAVFADTHGNREAMRSALSSEGPFDLMVHLGDGLQDAVKVSEETGVRLCGVLGNEDFGLDFPVRRTLDLGAWQLLLMHGYQFDITPYQGREIWEKHYRAMAGVSVMAGADALLFGHTHQALVWDHEGTLLCNPGSHYIGMPEPPTFIVLDVDGDELGIRLLQKSGKAEWETVLKKTITRERAGAAAARR